MEIDVRTVGYRDNLQELTIKEDNTTIVTGLINKDECKEMARIFVRAAIDLLPDTPEKDKLYEVEEVL